MPDTGAPYFIPYVDPTDLVRDYPAANEAMALAIVAALEDIPVTIKKVDAFTGSGTFTVPAGVTYAIAHMMGGGGGSGTGGQGDGADSSVAFASGTVTGPGLARNHQSNSSSSPVEGKANTGQNAQQGLPTSSANRTSYGGAPTNLFIIAGAAVTPAAEITVTVGAGGAAGTGGAAGGSGYVYIEYFEEA